MLRHCRLFRIVSLKCSFYIRFTLFLVMMTVMLGNSTINAVLADTLIVTNINDSGDGSLRQAIMDAAPGDTISFDPSLAGQTISLSSTLVIDKLLTIDGSALEPKIRVSGNHTVTVFQVTAFLLEVTFRNLIIIDGSGDRGGGVYLPDHTFLTMENCSLLFNSARLGGGAYVGNATLQFRTSAVGNNVASEQGGGMYGDVLAFLNISDSTFIQNQAGQGGGIFANEAEVAIRESFFTGNAAALGGGMYQTGTENGYIHSAAVIDTTFTHNTAGSGGGIYSISPVGQITVSKSTFSFNQATTGEGGGIYNDGRLGVGNSTFYANQAATSGGGIFDTTSLSIDRSTFSENSALLHGGAIYTEGAFSMGSTILANSPSGSDCYQGPGGTMWYELTNLIEQNSSHPNRCGNLALPFDPVLGPLQDNGGLTRTMALRPGSPAIDAGDDLACASTDQRGVARPQGEHCDIGAYEARDPIEIFIAGESTNAYALMSGQSKRVSFPGINRGPLQVIDILGTPLVAAERVIYKVNGMNTSFSEMMGLPHSQVHVTYWLPWYNNVDLDTQLRIANVSAIPIPATVHVTIAGQEMPGSPFSLAAGESTRKSFANVNSGPVKIESNIPIVAAERVIYKVNGMNTSFSEMMGLSHSQLDSTYWLPWYNNVDLDTQLRIANVTNQDAMVHIWIGTTEVTPAEGLELLAGASQRLSYTGMNNGPVKIVSTQNIVAAERVLYKVNGKNTSFSEMMALPNNQLDTTHWLPWYNNVDLDTQLRIGNVSESTATVHVFIGGMEVTPVSGIIILKGESTRLSYASVNDGPVQIVSNVQIVAAERVIYKVNNIQTSFSELMALPASELDTTYWFPWYNNVNLDTQLRFGVP